MTRNTPTLDDIAESIIDLGTLMSDQITELRHDMLGEITGVRDSLSSEVSEQINDLRVEMNKRFYAVDSSNRDTQSRLIAVDNESKAIRNDIMELHDLTAT